MSAATSLGDVVLVLSTRAFVNESNDPIVAMPDHAAAIYQYVLIVTLCTAQHHLDVWVLTKHLRKQVHGHRLDDPVVHRVLLHRVVYVWMQVRTHTKQKAVKVLKSRHAVPETPSSTPSRSRTRSWQPFTA